MGYVKDLGNLSVGTTATTAVTTLTATPAAGVGITIEAVWNGSGTIPAGNCTDSKGNTWTQILQDSNTSVGSTKMGVWFTNQDVAPLVTGDTITLTFSVIGTTNSKITLVQEWSGAITVDKTAVNHPATAGTTLGSGTTAVTTQAVETILVAYATAAVQATWTTPDTGFTKPTLGLLSQGVNRSLLVEYKDVTATGAQSASGGSYPTSCVYASVIATLKLATGAGAQNVSASGLGSAQSFGTLRFVLTKAVGGLSSAQAFGAVTVKTAVALPVGGVPSAQAFGIASVPQRVSVAGLYPNGFIPSICGGPVCGDGHVCGGSAAAQFGTVTPRIVTLAPVGGVSSAQSFGAVTIKTAVSRTVTGLGSAQAFGTVTIKTTVAQPAGGVTSAQAFGTVTPIAGAVIRTVTGLGSAQAFGVVSPSVGFGPQTRIVTGLGSAQSFGALTIRGSVTRSVTGLGTAQAFGTPTTRITRTVGGVTTAQAFGVPKTRIAFAVGGVSSAQAFGAIIAKTSQVVHVGGVSSAGRFGSVVAAQLFLHDLACIEQELAALVCLQPGVVPLCGVPICGDGTVCGGISPFLSVPGTSTLGLTPLAPGSLTLVPTDEQTLVLQPADCR